VCRGLGAGAAAGGLDRYGPELSVASAAVMAPYHTVVAHDRKQRHPMLQAMMWMDPAFEPAAA
jgi:hypothetical protein